MVKTDRQLIEEVLTRGVEQIFPKKEVLEAALSSGKRLRLYCGFDPSAASLHIGNAILINKLRQFQELGHEVIFLVGDFTGMIGDPTDKTATRQQLTREEVLANATTYQAQAEHYLDFKGDNPAQLKYNSEWQDKLTFKDLVAVSAHFTVGQMMARDMFQKRITEEKPIFLHEFLYPLAQGYDSVAMEVDLEIGGNDQMFNMLCGRDLSKAMLGKEKCVMTLKLLADADGNKMGKTTGNAVFLDAPANDIYGAVMSWSDGVILPAWELATTASLTKIAEVKARLDGGENPKNLKAELATELVTLFCGADSAVGAAEHFRLAVSEKTAPADLLKITVSADEDLFTAVVKFYDGKRSNTQIRQLFSDKAVYYNDQPTDDLKLRPASGATVRVGKKDWFEIA